MTKENLRPRSIEEILEIVIPTYNRPESIRNIAKEIAKSKLSKCHITILDNNSSDDEWRKNTFFNDIGLQNVSIITRNVNIGAPANIMQAYEIPKKEYLWILCDDDITDFSDEKIKDISNHLLNEKPDCYIVGTPYYDVLQKDQENIQNIAKYENVLESLPVVLSFVPSAILKTKWLYSCDFELGHKLVRTCFNQFFWISRVIMGDALVNVSPAPLVVRPNMETGYGSALLHFMYYAEAACSIESRSKRKKAIRSYFRNRKVPLILHVLKLALSDKSRSELPNKINNQVLEEVLGINYLIFSLILPLVKYLPGKYIKYAIQIKKNNK